MASEWLQAALTELRGELAGLDDRRGKVLRCIEAFEALGGPTTVRVTIPPGPIAAAVRRDMQPDTQLFESHPPPTDVPRETSPAHTESRVTMHLEDETPADGTAVVDDVAVMAALTNAARPMPVGEIERVTKLSRYLVKLSLKRLTDAGKVTVTGQTTGRRVSLATQGAVAPPAPVPAPPPDTSGLSPEEIVKRRDAAVLAVIRTGPHTLAQLMPFLGSGCTEAEAKASLRRLTLRGKIYDVGELFKVMG